jgi:hypothetical protein
METLCGGFYIHSRIMKANMKNMKTEKREKREEKRE